jgi:hypothetical protein
MDYTFLWNEEASEEEVIAGYQQLINSGMAWHLEGSVGRTAKEFIDAGLCMLGEYGNRDYWGKYIPSRHEVEPGTPGSPEYYEEHNADTD